MLACAAAVPRQKGEADGRGILGAGEAQIQRDGSEISGDGWPVRGDQAQAQPPAAVGQRGTGLEGWANTGTVDVDGVVVEPGRLFSEEGGNVSVGGAVW